VHLDFCLFFVEVDLVVLFLFLLGLGFGGFVGLDECIEVGMIGLDPSEKVRWSGGFSSRQVLLDVGLPGFESE
jgi:hypothetical protein